MHAVKKPDQVVRAVAVYEWTGEEGKATASRVVPVSLFIDGQFQDAAIYLARPVPFAIDTGTVYEVRKAGVDAGTLELVYERHLTSGDTAEIDDGWLGYGEFKVKPKETYVAKAARGPLPKVLVSGNSSSEAGGPKMVTRGGSSGEAGSASANGSKGSGSTASVDAGDDDPSVPVLHRRAGSEGDVSAPTSESSGSAAASTPTNPTASTRTSEQGAASDASTASNRGSSSGTNSDDDAERPTLKRRTPAEIKAKQKQKDSARVIAGNDLNDDQDRPTLHRGSKTMSEEEEVPPLRGTPKDMKQAVAVSDAKDRPEHDFVRQWESEDEHAQVLAKMQGFAREQLAAYKGTAPAAAASGSTSSAAAASGLKKTPTTAAVRAVAKKAAAAAPPSPIALSEESLKGYTLSYGGAATYVYTATSPGASGVTRYVSVVAQDEPTVGLKVALASVTDSSHLDRTPWMRFVDVVDADASNRASLMMELRAQHTRQFALYRVIGAQADQIFLSGSTE